MKTLKITEIFYSLQGETHLMGLPTVFIRLTGCPLRCGYCDTAYAFQGGKTRTLQDILGTVAIYAPDYVTVTGGEPLAQFACLELLTLLCDANYQVSLETSGALPIRTVDPRVCKILDIKTPGSKEATRNDLDNIVHLLPTDKIKFVICDRQDYEWATLMIATHQLLARCEVLFSPSHDVLDNKTLADWIIADRLKVRFQLQMHKYIWGDVPGK